MKTNGVMNQEIPLHIIDVVGKGGMKIRIKPLSAGNIRLTLPNLPDYNFECIPKEISIIVDVPTWDSTLIAIPMASYLAGMEIKSIREEERQVLIGTIGKEITLQLSVEPSNPTKSNISFESILDDFSPLLTDSRRRRLRYTEPRDTVIY